MGALSGVHHIATVSRDLDALIDFYERVFEANVLADVEIPQLPQAAGNGQARHAFIAIGGPSVLHAWEIDGIDPARFDGEIFDRGRVDHFALQTDSYANFERLRGRLVNEGVSTGEVTDFGVLLSFSFTDPDGLWVEVCWWKDGPELSTLDMSLLKDPIADAALESAK